jgi:hypothetical protein
MPAGRARARGRSNAESIDDAGHRAGLERVMARSRCSPYRERLVTAAGNDARRPLSCAVDFSERQES